MREEKGEERKKRRIFFFKQKTAYEIKECDWSSDVCSSDLYKNKDPFEEKNYAKIIIATNNLPATTDKTIGFYRRWLIIDFPNQFSEKIDILDEIPEEEYQALALKCVHILKDVLEKREFFNEGSIEDRMKKYEDKSNPLERFLKEYTIEDPDGFIWKHEFSKKLNEW